MTQKFVGHERQPQAKCFLRWLVSLDCEQSLFFFGTVERSARFAIARARNESQIARFPLSQRKITTARSLPSLLLLVLNWKKFVLMPSGTTCTFFFLRGRGNWDIWKGVFYPSTPQMNRKAHFNIYLDFALKSVDESS